MRFTKSYSLLNIPKRKKNTLSFPIIFFISGYFSKSVLSMNGKCLIVSLDKLFIEAV